MKTTTSTTNGKTTRAIKPLTDPADLRDEAEIHKRIALRYHQDAERAKLRAGFVGWHAHLLAELDHLDQQFADEDSELYAAFGPEEANALRLMMSQLCQVAGNENRPKCVPAFLATSTVTLPKA